MGKGGKAGEMVEKIGNVGEKGGKCENEEKNVEKVGILGEMEGKGRNPFFFFLNLPVLGVYIHRMTGAGRDQDQDSC